MLCSARVGLLALLRGLRFVGNTLKHFLLRCLLFWPHVLRSLRRNWPLCSRASPEDVPKKKDLEGQARPSFPRASGCEGYSIIYASRDPNRSGELHIRSGSTEVLHLAPIVGQSQSVPPNPSDPPSPSSSHLSDRHFPGASTSSIVNPDDIQLPHIPHLNAPLTLTHSRITSTQFAGAPRRSRPPSPLPYSHPLSQPTPVGSPAASPAPSRPPSPPSSPLPFPQPVPLPQSSSPGGTQMLMPDMEPTHDTTERHHRLDIMVYPPSRSQTAEAESQGIDLPQPPPSIQLSDAEHWTQEPSDAGSLGSGRVTCPTIARR